MKEIVLFQTEKEVKFGKVLCFILPTYLTSLFNTLYTIIDGIFVSNYAGSTALAAINIVYPLVNILYGIALAFATGGSSLMAIAMGSGDQKKAEQIFSISFVLPLLIGGIFSALMLGNLSSVLRFLGATAPTMRDCKIYAFLWLVGFPAVIGKELFTYFIRVDGSPKWSLAVALSGGIENIILDYFFVEKMEMGILGAGLATILGLILSLCTGWIYYLTRKKHSRFCFPVHLLSEGIHCMRNGASEFINQLATAITTVVFNRTALELAGESGIAAVSIIMYLQFIFIGIYFGYSMGISPLLSYTYGKGERKILLKLEKYSHRFLMLAAPIIYGITFFGAPFAVSVFVAQTETVYAMAVSGMRLYGLGFLFAGFNIFAAIRLMSYGRGHLSGIITFFRSFGLLLFFLILLPKVWGITGVWLAVPAAEIVTFIIFNKESSLSLFSKNFSVILLEFFNSLLC